MEYIEIGKREGALLLERPIPGNGGHFTSLAIFTGILPEHRLAREEIFGPVLAVMKARDFQEALALAMSVIQEKKPGSAAEYCRAEEYFRVDQFISELEERSGLTIGKEQP